MRYTAYVLKISKLFHHHTPFDFAPRLTNIRKGGRKTHGIKQIIELILYKNH